MLKTMSELPTVPDFFNNRVSKLETQNKTENFLFDAHVFPSYRIFAANFKITFFNI